LTEESVTRENGKRVRRKPGKIDNQEQRTKVLDGSACIFWQAATKSIKSKIDRSMDGCMDRCGMDYNLFIHSSINIHQPFNIVISIFIQYLHDTLVSAANHHCPWPANHRESKPMVVWII
jgi:hypothetical protein